MKKKLIFEVEEKPERGNDDFRYDCHRCPFLIEGDGWYECTLDIASLGVPCQEYNLYTLEFIGEEDFKPNTINK